MAAVRLSASSLALAEHIDCAKLIHCVEYSKTPSREVRSTRPESHGLSFQVSHRCTCTVELRAGSSAAVDGETVKRELVLKVLPQGTSWAEVRVEYTTESTVSPSGCRKRQRCFCLTRVDSTPQGSFVASVKVTIR